MGFAVDDRFWVFVVGPVDYCYSGFLICCCEVELKSPSVLIRFVNLLFVTY